MFVFLLNGLFDILFVVLFNSKLFGYKYVLFLGDVGCCFIGFLFSKLVILNKIVCNLEKVKVFLFIENLIVCLIDFMRVLVILFFYGVFVGVKIYCNFFMVLYFLIFF